MVAPPGVPARVAEKLSHAMREIAKMPDVQSRLVDAGDEAFDVTPAELSAFLREERQRWGVLIKTIGITAQ